MVHIVGAGCGAPDLITLRGKAYLDRADVIIYAGSLVNPALLAYAKDGCAVYDSAKMTLEEIVDVVAAAERDGKTTVRLHTGDPSLYGAIGEQMRAFDAHGIKYDITPGVSAFAGAAAALNIEYTLPDVSQTVIITRAEGATPVPAREKLSALAAHGATMVLFLSTGLLGKVTAALTEGGYAADTPAAIVYKASWPEEKVLRCTLATLEKTAAENHISKTALIVVGRVLDTDFARSMLYHPSFSTEFREASK
ncbi:MAG: precorrin-4 C(11)-methyltransferase [Clostridia bacterium]|nr:precorrin-4 C(11)-methyltransferase [Clostridia bacterium]